MINSIKFWWLRIILFVLFLSYYIVAIASNFSSIYNNIDFIRYFNSNAQKINAITYTGSAPTIKDIIKLKKVYHIKRIISLLDPRFPISKELSKSEKQICKKNGIEFIQIPYAGSRKDSYKSMIIADIMQKYPKQTYIHGYSDDRGIGIMLKKLNIVKENR